MIVDASMPDFANIQMTQTEKTEAIRKWTIHKQRHEKKKSSHVYAERLSMEASFLKSKVGLRYFRFRGILPLNLIPRA